MQMKKTALIIAALTISVHAFCQSDTIPLNYPYYYPAITLPQSAHYEYTDPHTGDDGLYCFPWTRGEHVFDIFGIFTQGSYTYIGAEYVAPYSMTVIGMACCLASWYPLPDELTPNYEDYEYTNCNISIARAVGDSVAIFLSAPLHPSLENISKRMIIDYPDWQEVPREKENWVFEIFLNTPTTIEAGDTFYLSASGILPNSGDQYQVDVMTSIIEGHLPPDVSNTHWTPHIFRTKNYYTGEWSDIGHPVIPLIWLIIQRDEDTCSVPQLYAERLSDNTVFVRWDNNANHAAAEFSFGPAGIAPEDGTITQSPIPQHVFGNLDPDQHYTVYARARCDFARSEWTDWSAPLDIHLASMAGIEGAAASPDLILAPNPAADEARIACSHAMQSVTLFAADGTAVLAVRPDATETTIDLRQLPAGAYTVVVTTAAGNESSRIVKQ